MRTMRLPAYATLALLAAAGCTKSRPTEAQPGGAVTVPAGGPGGGTVTVSPASCTSCHGDAARLAGAGTNPLIAAAPPRGLLGETVGRPVGAHDKHLRDGLAAALACANCHLMPAGVTAHPAQAQPAGQGKKVTFTVALPNADTTWLQLGTGSATWDGTSCSSTYCHGNFPGGNAATVAWQGGSAACGSCHGTPPATIRNNAAHPTSTNCGGCHGTGYSQTAVTGAAVATHVDGRVTLAGTGACDSCHGQPPTGLTSGGVVHPPRTDCGSCHPGATSPGPGQVAGPGHQNGTVDLSTLTCTSCHGTAGRTGNVAGTDPLLAAAPPVDTSNAASGGTRIGAHQAHVNPAATGQLAPPVACAECHSGAVPDPAVPAQLLHATTLVTPVAFGTLASHNGSITTAGYTGGSCSSTYCHGNFQNGAGANPISWSTGSAACGSCHGLPPAGTHPTLAAGRACSDCHPGYTGTQGGSTWGVNLVLHLNGAVDGGGHPAGWADPAQHGLSAISFTPPYGGLVYCTACHTNFGTAAASSATPGASDCNACHTTAGHAGWLQECTFCHGGNGGDTSGAPPRDTHAVRNTAQATTLATVGAHASHLQATHAIAAPLACTACHQTLWASADPTAAPGHVDAATATVGPFGNVGTTANPGTYARATGCAATYCHGNFTGGAGSAAVAWTGTFGGAFTLTCTSCHGDPPAASTGHVQRTDCATCHGPGYSNTAITGAALTTHLNGTVELPVTFTCTTCHGTAGRTTTGAGADANLAAAPPVATTTASATTDVRVGVHQSHVMGTRSRAQACSTCHSGAVPTAGQFTHANGTTTVAFGAVGAAPGTGSYGGSASPTCSSTYCHGNFTGGAGTGATPAFNAAGTLACTSCHGTPPPLNATVKHPQTGTTACSLCHAGYTVSPAAVVQATHVDGTIQAPTGCTACHGDTTASPQPVANTDLRVAPGYNANAIDSHGNAGTAISQRGVGAHNLHLTTALSTSITCAQCHGTLPAAGDKSHASGGNPLLSWGGVASANGASPTAVQAASVTCSASWCHGGRMSGGSTSTNLAWNAATLTPTTCTSCHGLPPTTTSTGHYHPQRTDCATCHGAGYSSSAVTGAAVATHVNGTVEYATLACTTCHGSAGRANTAALGAFDANQTAAPPVDSSNAATGQHVGAHLDHVNPAGGTGQMYVPVSCVTCHPNNTANLHNAAAGNGAPVVTFGGAATLNGAAPSYTGATPDCSATYCHGGTFGVSTRGTYTGGWTWNNATAAACDSCHLTPPTTPGHAALAHPSPTTVCSTCHDKTVNASGNIIFTGTGAAATTTHINGLVEGGESSGNTDCSTCHTFGMTSAEAARTSTYHHALAVGATITAGATVYPTSAATNSCVQCHADHNVFRPDLNAANTSGRAANLRTNIAVAPTAVAPASGNYGNADNAAASPFGLCVSCHSASQTKDQANQRSDGTVATPVVDGANFANANAAHKYGVSGTITRDNTNFTLACAKCHSSDSASQYQTTGVGRFTFMTHTSVDRRLLNPMGITAPADNLEEKFCYRCHHKTGDTSPGGGPAKTLANNDYFSAVTTMSSGSQAIFGLMGAAGSGHRVANYAGVHKPNPAEETWNGVAANNPAKHVECTDCHDPHEAQQGANRLHTQGSNVLGGALVGSSGVTPTWPASNFGAPSAYTWVPNLTASGFEYQVCFKCHSGANTSLATWDATWTNVAQEFNTANASYHPVVGALPATEASPGSNRLQGNLTGASAAQQQVYNAWFNAGAVASKLMTCSDCHGDSSTSPAASGPHGSAVNHILKGPNVPALGTSWADATLAALPGVTSAQTGPVPNGTGNFCQNCHAIKVGAAYTNNVHGQDGAHTSNNCGVCHIVVPHGGAMSRLLGDGNGTAMPLRYARGGVRSNILLESFTKPTNSRTFSTANCGSNATACTSGHGGNNATENW